MTGFAASADESPCPQQLDYFLMIYIDNGFRQLAVPAVGRGWVEASQLTSTEGSGIEAERYYVGALYSSQPYAELEDPNHHWHAGYSAIALQSP
jgi:hypothetical protein